MSGDLRDEYEVVVTSRRPEVVAELQREFGVQGTTRNADAVTDAEVVLLCFKPQAVAGVLSDSALRAALKGRLVVSIAAGITIAQLCDLVPGCAVVRAMPNTPAVIGEGMTAVSPGPDVTGGQLELVRRIFSSVGRCTVLEEKHLDAVTGLSGSGPAFACVILEALADGGVMMGLPRSVAVERAAQTMQGAARLVLASGEHPAALRDRVTTPAGCTIAGLFKMEEGRVRSTLARTVQEATRVAAGLGQEEH